MEVKRRQKVMVACRSGHPWNGHQGTVWEVDLAAKRALVVFPAKSKLAPEWFELRELRRWPH